MNDPFDSSGGQPSIYLNTVLLLNDRWAKLLEKLDSLDLRAMYLRSFELVLSTTLPKPLSGYDEYEKVAAQPACRLPDDLTRTVPYDVFAAWVTAYTEIMRQEGIVGRKTYDLQGDDRDSQ